MNILNEHRARRCNAIVLFQPYGVAQCIPQSDYYKVEPIRGLRNTEVGVRLV